MMDGITEVLAYSTAVVVEQTQVWVLDRHG